jgi:death-on-curing family protein
MIVEITTDEVVNINNAVIKKYKSWNPDSDENHHVLSHDGLSSCLGSVFYRDFEGKYFNAPITRFAGLILYRIAEGQYFENANKRTAFFSSKVFLMKNGYGLNYNKKEASDLMWGFAVPMGMDKPKYFENDAINFIENSIYILP